VLLQIKYFLLAATKLDPIDLPRKGFTPEPSTYEAGRHQFQMVFRDNIYFAIKLKICYQTQLRSHPPSNYD